MIVTLRRIRNWGACEDNYYTVKEYYPNGVPVTMEAYDELIKEGVDVIWGLIRLLRTKKLLKEFILFTMQQRQPYIVKLLHCISMSDLATEFENISFDTDARYRDASTILHRAIERNRTTLAFQPGYGMWCALFNSIADLDDLWLGTPVENAYCSSLSSTDVYMESDWWYKGDDGTWQYGLRDDAPIRTNAKRMREQAEWIVRRLTDE